MWTRIRIHNTAFMFRKISNQGFFYFVKNKLYIFFRNKLSNCLGICIRIRIPRQNKYGFGFTTLFKTTCDY